MKLFFFGMGYSAAATARAVHRLIAPATPIAGTTRSADRADTLADSAVRLHLFEGTDPGPTLAEDLGAASHVVDSIPPDENGDLALRHHRPELDGSANLEWLCYYSTVGVYGDFGGAWIDESAACHPGHFRSRQRLIAEDQWRAYAKARGVPLLILRLAGIYGPGRSAFEKLNSGTARRIVKAGQVFNRIHVADIGRMTALAAARNLSGTFNLCDDLPAPPQELVAYAAELMGVPPPPEIDFENADLTDMARSFYSDNKRVCNAALKQALGVDLLYPTYRDGLAGILAQ